MDHGRGQTLGRQHMLAGRLSARLDGYWVVNARLAVMAGVNAGSRRNRLPTGLLAVQDRVNISPRVATALGDAARGSGNLSLSLYLERLMNQMINDHDGSLPLMPDEALEALKNTA